MHPIVTSWIRRGLTPALLAALVTSSTAEDAPAPPHHTADGFRNNDIGTVDKSVGDLWQLARWVTARALFGDGRPQPRAATPVMAPALDEIQRNARAGAAMTPTATWIGHATVLVQASGLNVLTDPHFSERASPVSFAGFRRQQPPGLALADLPHIDVVVISHNHYDHLDVDSLRQLAAQPGGPPRFLVPLGLKRWLDQRLGIADAVELDWWQSHPVGAVTFYLTPVQHWSGRSLWDRHETLWGGWAVLAPDFDWYFAGDTGYSSDFQRTRAFFRDRQGERGFDLALLPIGAYEPNWFMKPQHVNPREAVQIHRDLAARHSLAVHWGTFDLSDEPLDQPPQDLAVARREAGLPDEAFRALAIGESWRFASRTPAGE